jgi:hypothetical protein
MGVESGWVLNSWAGGGSLESHPSRIPTFEAGKQAMRAADMALTQQLAMQGNLYLWARWSHVALDPRAVVPFCRPCSACS